MTECAENVFQQKSACEHRLACAFLFTREGLVLLVTDTLFLCGIEEQVADSGNQRINTKGKVCEEEVCQSSGGVALGLKAAVVNDDTADPAQEEGQQKTDQIVVLIA